MQTFNLIKINMKDERFRKVLICYIKRINLGLLSIGYFWGISVLLILNSCTDDYFLSDTE